MNALLKELEVNYDNLERQEAEDLFLIKRDRILRQIAAFERAFAQGGRVVLEQRYIDQLDTFYIEYKRDLITLKRKKALQTNIKKYLADYKNITQRYQTLQRKIQNRTKKRN